MARPRKARMLRIFFMPEKIIALRHGMLTVRPFIGPSANFYIFYTKLHFMSWVLLIPFDNKSASAFNTYYETVK